MGPVRIAPVRIVLVVQSIFGGSGGGAAQDKAGGAAASQGTLSSGHDRKLKSRFEFWTILAVFRPNWAPRPCQTGPARKHGAERN